MSDVTITTRVATGPDRAFQLFHDRVDAWWLRGPRFRQWTDSELSFERDWLTERRGDAVHRVARVIAREPGSLLRLELDGDEVVVRFEGVEGGTQVTVTQTRDAARTAFQDPAGLWWADLLTALRASAGAPP